jgi:hypothetical protein
LKVDDQKNNIIAYRYRLVCEQTSHLHNRGVQVNIEEVAYCRFGSIFIRSLRSSSRCWHKIFSSCWQMLEELRVDYAKVFVVRKKIMIIVKTLKKIDEIARKMH